MKIPAKCSCGHAWNYRPGPEREAWILAHPGAVFYITCPMDRKNVKVVWNKEGDKA
jgi:hypothetical protein